MSYSAELGEPLELGESSSGSIAVTVGDWPLMQLTDIPEEVMPKMIIYFGNSEKKPVKLGLEKANKQWFCFISSDGPVSFRFSPVYGKLGKNWLMSDDDNKVILHTAPNPRKCRGTILILRDRKIEIISSVPDFIGALVFDLSKSEHAGFIKSLLEMLKQRDQTGSVENFMKLMADSEQLT